MGIIGMKVPARGCLLATWNPPPLEQQKHSWEGMVLALTPGALQMREAMYFALSHPVSTVIIGCDSVAQLEENIQHRPFRRSTVDLHGRAPARSGGSRRDSRGGRALPDVFPRPDEIWRRPQGG